MRFSTRIAVPLFVALLGTNLGCSSKSHPQADLDSAQAAVVAALNNWKANEPASKLKASSPAVDFIEELRLTQTLTDFSVLKVLATDPEAIRVVVSLKLKDKKGKATEREATYSVSLKSPVVVSRDPYF